MKRKQLFEFEDQNWFPDFMRVALTKLLVVLHKMIGLDRTLAKLITRCLKTSGATQVVDLGSGAGGSMPSIIELIREDEEVNSTKMTLTDLFPNKETIESVNSLEKDYLRYESDPVDATHLDKAPKGLKTMINCFHHMPVSTARQILKTAADTKEPLLIYEMAENKIPFILWLFFLPISIVILMIMTLFMTPFVRPFTFKQLFFTYIIPIIPLAYAWDGQASMPRIYAIKDIQYIIDELNLESDKYHWEIGPVENEKGKKQGYYVFGSVK